MTPKSAIKFFMLSEGESIRDQQTGEVSPTILAELAADHFDHNEWLDDETNDVWDIAVEVSNEMEA